MIGSEGRNDGKPAPVVVDRKPCSGSDKEEGGRRGQLRTGRACGVRGATGMDRDPRHSLRDSIVMATRRASYIV